MKRPAPLRGLPIGSTWHTPERVAYVITGLALGGAEHQLLEVASRLVARGWEVLTISLIPSGPLGPAFEHAGIRVESLDLARGRLDPLAPLKLAARLRRFRPLVVHSHMVHGNLLARLSRPFYRSPVLISTTHSMQEGGRWRELGIRLTDPLCDLTTAVSQAVVDRYLGRGLAPANKLRVLPNGVDTARYAKAAEVRSRARRSLGVGGSFTWLAVGRLTPAKDYPTLLRAFAQLVRAGHDGRLLVVGEGPLQSEHEKLVMKLGVQERVSLLGLREDVAELMNAADAFVMSSAWEGLPMALLEASASELPIIATDVGGNREIVEPGRSGFLVPARNAAALAAMMKHLVDLPPAQRARLGTAGRSHVERTYGLERVVDAWETLYHRLLTGAIEAE